MSQATATTPAINEEGASACGMYYWGMEVPQFAIDLAKTKGGYTPAQAWELAGNYSDGFKDRNGFRPRSIMPDTIDGILEDFAKWSEEAKAEEAERNAEEKAQAEARKPAPPFTIGDLFPSL